MVIDKIEQDVEFFSTCYYHLLPFFGGRLLCRNGSTRRVGLHTTFSSLGGEVKEKN
jgi:GTP cyclohydrolase I